tara:strand:- start:1180 stop:1422 length:243 start_codon:yes stop_codon:yes gene_type:complete
MSDRAKKRYANKQLKKNLEKHSLNIDETSIFNKSFMIDSKKLDSIEKIQKAFELIKIKFNPPNEEAYNEYSDILSDYNEE